MLFQNLDNMNIDDVHTVVKVDDTVGGIQEGLNAGCWTVGVSRYSNYMNIDSEEHEKSLSAEQLEERNQASAEKLRAAGAHYVVDSIADLPGVVEKINKRLYQKLMP
jgi:phosphonoacetaldehyde hydrolase